MFPVLFFWREDSASQKSILWSGGRGVLGLELGKGEREVEE